MHETKDRPATGPNKMMIAFEVTSIHDFAGQVNAFLQGSGLAVVFAAPLADTAAAIAKVDTAIAETEAVSTPAPVKEPPAKEEIKAPAKAPKKPKKAEPQPVPSSETKTEDVSDEQGAEIVGITAEASLENQKVKDEVLDKLRDLYMAGRVKLVRDVLAKHGGGAKSFPEVEPARFPAIREALKAGADA